MLALERAKYENDDPRVRFYELAFYNLFKELQAMDAYFFIFDALVLIIQW